MGAVTAIQALLLFAVRLCAGLPAILALINRVDTQSFERALEAPREVRARCENVKVGDAGCRIPISAHRGTTERHLGRRTIPATQKSGFILN